MVEIHARVPTITGVIMPVRKMGALTVQAPAGSAALGSSPMMKLFATSIWGRQLGVQASLPNVQQVCLQALKVLRIHPPRVTVVGETTHYQHTLEMHVDVQRPTVVTMNVLKRGVLMHRGRSGNVDQKHRMLTRSSTARACHPLRVGVTKLGRARSDT
eukprot:TRINITY_DN18385_c0_g1_i1.p2 TRINITY_DN18385_c0_g1~~TRINITY_DN18385_c0_g1_i1.p2  ORF type:complete len:158 (-),score=17.11 TRINITY_DN18385_c0_g1_i1:149-622(-)